MVATEKPEAFHIPNDANEESIDYEDLDICDPSTDITPVAVTLEIPTLEILTPEIVASEILTPKDNMKETAGFPSPATQEAQKEFVKSHLNDSFQLGESWYLIDSKWYKSWKEYVHHEDCGYHPTGKHPGIMDNAPLLSDSGHLKEHMLENVNYTVIPAILWQAFTSWFGTPPDQEPLECKVIETGAFVKSLKVEVYPLTVFLVHYKQESTNNLHRLSHGTTIGQLMDTMRTMFNVSAETEVKLLGSFSHNLYDELTDATKTVSDYNIISNQYIILVEKENGAWPSNSSVRKPVSASKSADAITNTGYVGTTSSYGRVYNKNGYNSSSDVYLDASTCANGLCGLNNLGNTCFMNSALQSMSNVPELTKFFLSEDWTSQLNRTNPLGMKGQIAETYAELIQTMWDGKHSSTAPRRFKGAVGSFAPRFSGYQQQDAQELLAFLLDGLHEDLNRITKKPYVEIKAANGRPDEEVAEEAWHDYKLRNDSIIIDLFHGLLKSTLVCPKEKCGNVSVTFDPFCYLSLPLPTKNERTMEVFFVSKDKLRRPLKCKVQVPKKGSIKSLIAAVSALTSIPSSRLIVAEVYHHKLHKIYEENEALTSIYAKDIIYLYEIDPSTELVNVAVYFREKRSRNYSTQTTFGLPLIISLPKECSYDQLYSLLNDECSRIIHPKPAEEAVEQMEVCGSPKPNEPYFTITLVNVAGSPEVDAVSPEQTIKLKEQMCLALDFDHEMMGVVDREEAEAYDDHPSVHEEQAKRELNIEACIEKFTSTETLGESDMWYCPKCKEHVEADKKFDIWNLPKYLVIHLKRFQYSRYLREKIDTFVDYPVQDFDLSPWVKGDKSRPHKYNLRAVCNHFGGLGAGHYTAYAKNSTTDQWHYFDDSMVSRASAESAVTKSGYVLVYERDEP